MSNDRTTGMDSDCFTSVDLDNKNKLGGAMSKGRIYISGPITGTTDYNRRFNLAEKMLKLAGYEPVNPAKINGKMPDTTTHEQYMHVSYALMDTCDAVYMTRGWEKSKGCKLELKYAVENGISLTFEGGTCHGQQTHKGLRVFAKGKSGNIFKRLRMHLL